MGFDVASLTWVLLVTVAAGCGSQVEVRDTGTDASTTGAAGSGGAAASSTTSSTSTVGSSTSTAASTAGSGGGGPVSVSVRLAQLSPFLEHTPDVCIGSDADGFAGPLLGTSDGSVALAYGDVSAYASVVAKPGAEVRIVRLGAGCGDDAIVAPSTVLGDAPAAKLTVLLAGVLGEGEYTMTTVYADDDDASDPTARLRVVNATVDGSPIDFSANLCTDQTNPLLFAAIPSGGFGTTSPLGPVSPNGFLTTQMACFGPVHVTGNDGTSAIDVAGSLFTSGAMSTFVVGALEPSFAIPVQVITCFDPAPGSGPLSNCQTM